MYEYFYGRRTDKINRNWALDIVQSLREMVSCLLAILASSSGKSLSARENVKLPLVPNARRPFLCGSQSSR